MYFIQIIKNRIVQFAALLIISGSTIAQSTATAAPVKEGSNLLAILLIITSLVLAFVIWGMGQALVTISRQVMLKNKSAEKVLTIALITGLTLLGQFGHAQTGETIELNRTP
jgi:hypothetical protein